MNRTNIFFLKFLSQRSDSVSVCQRRCPCAQPRCPPVSSDLPPTCVRPTPQDLPVVRSGRRADILCARPAHGDRDHPRGKWPSGDSGSKAAVCYSSSVTLLVPMAVPMGLAARCGKTGSQHQLLCQLSERPSRSLCSPQTSDLGRNLLEGSVGGEGPGPWKPGGDLIHSLPRPTFEQHLFFRKVKPVHLL